MQDNKWGRLLAYVTGLVNQGLLLQCEYLVAENRILRSHVSGRLRLSDPERSTLAEIAQRLGRQHLAQVACIAGPDTILACYRRLIARKFDGSKHRSYSRCPRHLRPTSLRSSTLRSRRFGDCSNQENANISKRWRSSGALPSSMVQLGTTALPSPADLYGLSKAVAGGKQWNDLLPGVATVSLTVTGGTGPQIGLRITKKDGIPVHIVRDEAASGTPVIAVKRVDELGFYNLGRDDLADKVGLNKMMTTAMIWHLQLQGDADYHKEIQIGSQRGRPVRDCRS